MVSKLMSWQRLYLEAVLQVGTYDPEEMVDLFGPELQVGTYDPEEING